MPLKPIFGTVVHGESNSPQTDHTLDRSKQNYIQSKSVGHKHHYRIDGSTASLDANATHARTFRRIIESSIADGAPIYLEVDPITQEIRDLQVPYRTTVNGIEPAHDAETNSVDLSFGTGILKRGNPRYALILALLLESAGLTPPKRIWIVTKPLDGQDSSDEPIVEIIDARAEPTVPVDPNPPTTNELDESEFVPISLEKCDQLFSFIAQLDTPNAAPSLSKGTIPFRFVEHGCEARAHEVCRHILNCKIRPIKVWVFYKDELLRLTTNLHPKCKVVWGFHVVAAVITVDGIRVLDPSLSDRPMSIAGLRARFDNRQVHIEATGPEVYLMTQDRRLFKTDPYYKETNQFLAGLNRAFDLMLAYFPPPPYSYCYTQTTDTVFETT